MILMCKNKQVYRIDKETVINTALLPGLMRKNPCEATFKQWLRKRYSSNTNTIARKLKGITFGQGNRVSINKETRAMSLSDCYWVMDEHNSQRFEEISPYYNTFWKGYQQYQGGAIPTLYVSGYLSKYWDTAEWLVKEKSCIEIECSRLCRLSNIECAEVQEFKGKGIRVKNITSPKYMLEQADMSGNFDEDEYTDTDIVKEFGIYGFKMILIDAVVANGDRHLGNFGYLRDTDTGKYLKMAPLYDFDHALDTTGTNDILTKSVMAFMRENHLFKNEAMEMLEIIIKNTTIDVFKSRAHFILNQVR